MAFSFIIEDTNHYWYRIAIDDEGNAEILEVDGSPINEEQEETYIALTKEPEIVDNFGDTWNDIVTALEKEHTALGKVNTFWELLLSIRQHGTEQRRWMPPHRMDPSSGWHYETFIYELTLDVFVKYLGDAIEYQIPSWGGPIVDMVKLVQGIRKPDGTGFEFSIEPSGEWIEWPQRPGDEFYFTQDVTVFADDEEFFDYSMTFKREIYDPIFFTDEVKDDLDNAMALYHTESDLADAITLLGLKDEQIAIAEAAQKEVPQIEKPKMDKEGEFGVFYRFTDYTFDVRTGEGTEEEKTAVIPYESEEEAKKAFALAESIISRIADSRAWKECYLVRLNDDGQWEEWEGEE